MNERLDVGSDVAEKYCVDSGGGEAEFGGDGEGLGGGKDECGGGREGGDGSTETDERQGRTLKCGGAAATCALICGQGDRTENEKSNFDVA